MSEKLSSDREVVADESKNPWENFQEEIEQTKENEKAVSESLKSLSNNLNLGDSSEVIEMLGNVLGNETKRKEYLKRYEENKKQTDLAMAELSRFIESNSKQNIFSKFINSKANEKTKQELEGNVKEAMWKEHGALSGADTIRNYGTRAIDDLYPDTYSSTKRVDINDYSYEIKLEALRRRILSDPETKKLSKLSERFRLSYLPYEEPTKEDVVHPPLLKSYKENREFPSSTDTES